MLTAKDGRISDMPAVTPEYAAARKHTTTSSSVFVEQAKRQISENSPRPSGSVFYELVRRDGVSILKRSEKL